MYRWAVECCIIFWGYLQDTLPFFLFFFFSFFVGLLSLFRLKIDRLALKSWCRSMISEYFENSGSNENHLFATTGLRTLGCYYSIILYVCTLTSQDCQGIYLDFDWGIFGGFFLCILIFIVSGCFLISLQSLIIVFVLFPKSLFCLLGRFVSPLVFVKLLLGLYCAHYCCLFPLNWV